VINISINTPCARLTFGASTGLSAEVNACRTSDPGRERNGSAGVKRGEQGGREALQHVLVRHRTGSQSEYDGGRGNRTGHLRDAVQNEARRPNAATKEKREADVRVEEPARCAEKEPGRDEQAEPKRCCDIERLLEGRPLYFMRRLRPAKR